MFYSGPLPSSNLFNHACDLLTCSCNHACDLLTCSCNHACDLLTCSCNHACDLLTCSCNHARDLLTCSCNHACDLLTCSCNHACDLLTCSITSVIFLLSYPNVCYSVSRYVMCNILLVCAAANCSFAWLVALVFRFPFLNMISGSLFKQVLQLPLKKTRCLANDIQLAMK